MINRFPGGWSDTFRVPYGEAGMEFHIKPVAWNRTSMGSTGRCSKSARWQWPASRRASLRVSASLIALLTQAGYPVDWKQLEEVPTVCCGACGG
jgi:hypothetical protein